MTSFLAAAVLTMSTGLLVLGAKPLKPKPTGRFGRIFHQNWAPVEVDAGELLTGRFLAIGDWGCGDQGVAACPDSGRGQRRVAHALGIQAERAAADLVLNVGDAFYPYGVADADDQQWRTTFDAIYSAPSLQIPWYGVLGNHDWHRNASAVVTNRSRWKIPALSYVLRGRAAASRTPITVIFIDTNMVMSDDICRYRNASDWGPLSAKDFLACRQEIEEVFEPQLPWLEEQLEKAANSVKIVVGHHPVYSTGKWASAGDTAPKALEERLAPLFQRYSVQVYLSGHDHILQHLSANGTDYYILGAGGGVLEDEPHRYKTNALVRRTLQSSFGYGVLEVGSKDICMRFFTNEKSVASYGHCRPHGYVAEYRI